MEIQKYNQNQGLTPIKKAFMSAMVRNTENNQLIDILTRCIAKAFQDSGQQSNDGDAEYLISVMPGEIKKFHPNMRIEEISIAIECGIRGEYGQYFGLNVLTFSNFLKSYMESEIRKKQTIELIKETENIPSEPTKAEKFEAETKVIIQAYSKFCEVGFYDDYGNFIYNKLDERGLVPFTTERKLKIFEQAKESLLLKNNPKNANNIGERNALKATLGIITDGLEDARMMIATEAKKIALKLLFSDLKELETDIEYWLNGEHETA